MKKILLLILVVLLFSSCWRSWYRPVLSDTFFAIRNETPYSVVLSLYVNGRTPADLKTDKQRGSAKIDMDNAFGFATWKLDSVMVFNLNDTTSIVWSAIAPPNGSTDDSHFYSLFGTSPPQWITAPEDIFKWEISSKSWDWILVDDWHPKMLLTVTPALLEIMQKDYSMLERFPEFYEQD